MAGGGEMGILGILNDPQGGTQDSESLVYLENGSLWGLWNRYE